MSKFFIVAFLSLSIHVFAQTNTWDGSTDGDWHKACNWSLNLIPTCSHDVVIPVVGTTYPTVTGTAHSKSVSITATATDALTINSSGGGVLYIGSGGGSCSGVATDNGGCNCTNGNYLYYSLTDEGYPPCDFFGGGGACGTFCSQASAGCICQDPFLCISGGTCAEGPCGTNCYEYEIYEYAP